MLKLLLEFPSQLWPSRPALASSVLDKTVSHLSDNATHPRQLFCDFGENFIIEDPTEADPATAAIQHISQVGAEGLSFTCQSERGCHGPVEDRCRHC